jgi:hypothetical protein
MPNPFCTENNASKTCAYTTYRIAVVLIVPSQINQPTLVCFTSVEDDMPRSESRDAEVNAVNIIILIHHQPCKTCCNLLSSRLFGTYECLSHNLSKPELLIKDWSLLADQVVAMVGPTQRYPHQVLLSTLLVLDYLPVSFLLQVFQVLALAGNHLVQATVSLVDPMYGLLIPSFDTHVQERSLTLP